MPVSQVMKQKKNKTLKNLGTSFTAGRFGIFPRTTAKVIGAAVAVTHSLIFYYTVPLQGCVVLFFVVVIVFVFFSF